MSRVAYVNGRYVRHGEAKVHIEDRGYQFADGCYEVVAVHGSVFVDMGLHLTRLRRSLRELELTFSVSDIALIMIMAEIARRNLVKEGFVYVQITRGVAPRDFAFPTQVRPSLVVTARHRTLPNPLLTETGIRVITIPDQRWARPDIKSLSLLPNVLGRQQARRAGAYEAWQVDSDGYITEGTASNAWIIGADGTVITRKADSGILNGVTRLGLMHLLTREGFSFQERPFSVAEAKAAKEAFITSATSFLIPVVEIDAAAIGGHTPGPMCQRLLCAYDSYARSGGQD